MESKKRARRSRPIGPALRALAGLALGLAGLALGGCMQAYVKNVGADVAQVYSKIYLTDFNTAWQSTLDALKSSPLDVANREGGLIQTRWIENTSEKNLSDSIGSAGVYLKAQYRFRLSVGKGYYNGRPSVKVTVTKEQVVKRDALEGFQPTPTDSVEENTLLYRIGRLIYMRMKFAQSEEEKTRKAIESSGF